MIRSRHRQAALLSFVALLAACVGFVAAAPADDEPAEAAGHSESGADTSDHGHGDEEGEVHAGDESGHDVGHGDVDYNKPPLDVEIPLLVWSLVVFGVYLVVAKKVAWVPLISGLDSREARVNRALAEAEAARAEAEKLLAEHQAQLDEVTEQVKEIIAEARGEAEREKTRIIAEAETETTAMRDQAIADIHSAHEQALDGLDDRIDAQVQTATEHVLG